MRWSDARDRWSDARLRLRAARVRWTGALVHSSDARLLRHCKTGVDTSYFAHEFYHSYRRRFAVVYREHTPQDAGLEELLAYPVEEGVADQLDKRSFVDLSDADFAAYMRRPGAVSYDFGLTGCSAFAPSSASVVFLAQVRATERAPGTVGTARRPRASTACQPSEPCDRRRVVTGHSRARYLRRRPCRSTRCAPPR